MSNNPKKVTYSNGTKELTLHFDKSTDIALPLSTGLELTIYKEEGILKGELKVANPAHFDAAPVWSKILFQNIQYKGDIKGGCSEAAASIQLKNLDAPYIDIVNPDKFVLAIIGVDDIRALTSEPKYNQIYLMEEQRIFLKTTTSGNDTTLEIKYIKRS